MTWEERMAEKSRRLGRSGSRPHDRDVPPKPPEGEWNLVEGEWLAIPPWEDPPGPRLCELCYEWRRYPPGQEHFGFAWWRICDSNRCTCQHHKDEIWMASQLLIDY